MWRNKTFFYSSDSWRLPTIFQMGRKIFYIITAHKQKLEKGYGEKLRFPLKRVPLFVYRLRFGKKILSFYWFSCYNQPSFIWGNQLNENFFVTEKKERNQVIFFLFENIFLHHKDEFLYFFKIKQKFEFLDFFEYSRDSEFCDY